MRKKLKIIAICIVCLFSICINTVSFSSSEISYVESYKMAFSMDDIKVAKQEIAHYPGLTEDENEEYDRLKDKELDGIIMTENEKNQLSELEKK